jgi:hypothetical protein
VDQRAGCDPKGLEEKRAYPTVSPTPFCLSTLMSNDSSPEFLSHRTLHQFRLPMMNLPFEGVPSVSWMKRGSYSRRWSVHLRSEFTRPPYHLFVRQLIVHALMGFGREGVHHDQNAVWWTTERKLRANTAAFQYSRCIHNRAWLMEPQFA